MIQMRQDLVYYVVQSCVEVAPEETLRLSITMEFTLEFSNWPLYTANVYRQTADKLIFFCAISKRKNV